MSILPRMIARAETAAEQWSTEVTDLVPSVEYMAETCWVGLSSIRGLSSRRAFLQKDYVIRLGDFPETPARVAKYYLSEVYGQSPPIMHNQAAEVMESPPLPLYAYPGDYPDLWYLDLKSTYFSIMLLSGWDVDYWPGQWLGLGRPPHDFPFADDPRPLAKIARACLVSTAQSCGGFQCKPGGDSYFVRTGNRLINRQIYRLISDLLNSIAHDIRTHCKAVYIHTDGYILTSQKDVERAQSIVADWRLEARVKAQGPGYVVGTGVYKVGPKGSKRVKGKFWPHYYHGIARPDYRDWLYKRWASITR